MKVILAGFNVDKEIIEALASAQEEITLTPEVFSAAYARLSRSPKSAYHLRKEAREELHKARRSNKRIIFGMGHHSVAEHAVFNFDIMGITRLAVEEIEHFRLASFTEKSQRYQKLDDAVVVPEEISSEGFTEAFTALVRNQNRTYGELFELLLAQGLDACPKKPVVRKKAREAAEIRAKEDARYVTSLSTPTQLGATFNARALELLFRRFASHGLVEIQHLGQLLFETVEKIAPSVILFVEANDYDRLTYPLIEKTAAGFSIPSLQDPPSTDRASLVDYTPEADEKLTAALLHCVSRRSFSACREAVSRIGERGRKEILHAACRHMELYDPVLREFEHVSLSYELVVSASCFAQLKRHRMATITCQPYDPELGVEVPPSVSRAGFDEPFLAAVSASIPLYYEIASRSPHAAAYCLTNSHRRRVMLTVNARALYHFSRLREDQSAQWEIREVAAQMTEQARKVMPLVSFLACGKDRYPEVYRAVYGSDPKVKNPVLPGVDGKP